MAKKLLSGLAVCLLLALALPGGVSAEPAGGGTFLMRCRGNLVVPTFPVGNYYGAGWGHDRYGYWLSYNSFVGAAPYSVVVDVPGGLPNDPTWSPALAPRPQPGRQVQRGQRCRVTITGLPDRERTSVANSLANVSRRGFSELAAARSYRTGVDPRPIVRNAGGARVVASLNGALFNDVVYYHLAFERAGSSFALGPNPYDFVSCYTLSSGAHYIVVLPRPATHRIAISSDDHVLASGRPGVDPFQRNSRVFAIRVDPTVETVTIRVDSRPADTRNVAQCAY